MMSPSRLPHSTEEASARLALVHERMSCGSHPSLLEDMSGSSILNEREYLWVRDFQQTQLA